MTPNAKYQAAYRARYVRRGDALKAIIARLDGNDKALAIELRKIATDALEITDQN